MVTNSDREPTYSEMLMDLLSLAHAVLSEQRPTPLAIDQACGVLISTVITTDCGPETALMMNVKQYRIVVLERYDSKEAALEGHARWTSRIRDEQPATVTALGYGISIPNETVSVVYDERWAMDELSKQKWAMDELSKQKARRLQDPESRT